MVASRFLRSLLTAAKQSVIPSLQRRSPPASGRASFLRRLWPFTSSAEAKNNNSHQTLSSDTGGRLSMTTLNNPTPPTPARLQFREFGLEPNLEEGFDFEHWIVGMNRPPGATRDEVIDCFIKTLAKVVGSEEEARKKIYAVYTDKEAFFTAFAAQVSEEIANKIYELDNVNVILPDAYIDLENKRYSGEPFINGQAVPFHPKYRLERMKLLRMRPQNGYKSEDVFPNFDKSGVSETRKIDVPAGASDLPENNSPVRCDHKICGGSDGNPMMHEEVDFGSTFSKEEKAQKDAGHSKELHYRWVFTGGSDRDPMMYEEVDFGSIFSKEEKAQRDAGHSKELHYQSVFTGELEMRYLDYLEKLDWSSLRTHIVDFPRGRSRSVNEMRTIFEKWITYFGRTYDDQNKSAKFLVIKKRLADIDAHNSTDKSWKIGLNAWSGAGAVSRGRVSLGRAY